MIPTTELWKSNIEAVMNTTITDLGLFIGVLIMCEGKMG